ncbi:MAG: tetratricopeptide repeat protein [Negativicutes bacterium]
MGDINCGGNGADFLDVNGNRKLFLKNASIREACSRMVQQHASKVGLAFWLATVVGFLPLIIGSVFLEDEQNFLLLLGNLFIGFTFAVLTTKGYARFSFVAATGGEPQYRELLSNAKDVWRSFLAIALIGIKVFLWSLLLIIPGCIASWKYVLTFYVMNDQPELSVRQCLKKSEWLMAGNKLKLFKMYLHYLAKALAIQFFFYSALIVLLILVYLVVDVPSWKQVFLPASAGIFYWLFLMIGTQYLAKKWNTVAARFYHELVSPKAQLDAKIPNEELVNSERVLPTRKWYYRSWCIVLSCILFAPLGIFLMYRGRRYEKIPRLVAAIIIGAIFLFGAILFVEKEIYPLHSAEYYLKSGNAYGENGKYIKAIVEFNKAIKKQPDYDLAYLNRGRAYYESGVYDKAIVDYSLAISMDPKYSYAYYYRGLAYKKKGQLDKAMADFSQSIKLKSSSAQFYNARGSVFGEKGQYDQAILDFNQAIKLDPTYADVYYCRGLAYEKKGLIDKAIADFRMLKKLDHDMFMKYVPEKTRDKC